MSRITDRGFFEKEAKDLAKSLLGKVICYDGKKYMITVTEAYPYNDKDSYVNRYRPGSKGHDALVGNNTGNILIYGGMFHVVGRCNKKDSRCDNILIRGGIEVDKNNKLSKGNDKDLFLKKGKPYKFCRTVLGIQNDFCIRANDVIKDFYSISIDETEAEPRIGLDSTDCLKFSITKDKLEKIIRK